MDNAYAKSKLKALVRELSAIHQSIGSTLTEAEATVQQLRGKPESDQETRLKLAGEAIRLARTKVTSLLRREQASVLAYTAFRGLSLLEDWSVSRPGERSWDERALRTVAQALDRKRVALEEQNLNTAALRVNGDIKRVERELERLALEESNQVTRSELQEAAETISPIAKAERGTNKGQFGITDFELVLKKIFGEDELLEGGTSQGSDSILEKISLANKNHRTKELL